MSLLKRLFGGKTDSDQSAPAEVYGGFRIVPTPQKEGQVWRLSARIERGEGESLQQHHLIRADTLQSHDDAVAASVAKAKQMIDEQGERLFD